MKSFKILGLLAISAGIIVAAGSLFETAAYADFNTRYENPTISISNYNYRNDINDENNNMMNNEFNNNCSTNRRNSSCSNNMSEYENSNSNSSRNELKIKSL